MPNNGAYNNQAANAGERNVGPVGLTRLPVAGSMPAGVIFQDGFDDQPDWHSGLAENDTGANPSGLPDRVQRAGTHTFLNNWTSCYQAPAYAPSVGGDGSLEAISVLESDSSKCRGGTGKCYVGLRESYFPGTDEGYWASDSQLAKILDQDYSQLYVEIWLRLPEIWTKDAGFFSKILRISSWNRSYVNGGEFDAFGDGNLGPICLWEVGSSSYGVRNSIGFRGGPHGENYQMTNSDIPGLPRAMSYLGDQRMNWTGDMVGMGVGGSTPQVPDRVNGGFISDDLSQTVSHEQVFGDGSYFNKIAFFVKMNSAPGEKDGICRQWFNDEQIFFKDNIPWCGPTSQPLPGWNKVAIGGNDNFNPDQYPNSAQHQEWYAIDDVLIRDSIPEGL